MSLRTLLSLLGALVAVEVQAQPTSCASGSSCNLLLTAEISKVYVARLSLSQATTPLTTPTAAQFGSPAGVNTDNAVTLTVRSNAAHTITVAAATPTFTGGSGTKPASSLRFRDNLNSQLRPVTGTNPLVTGSSALVTGAVATGGSLYTISYNTTYDWIRDTPGSYSLTVSYTITAP